MLYKTLIRVQVKINPKASTSIEYALLFRDSCQYNVAPRKIQHDSCS